MAHWARRRGFASVNGNSHDDAREEPF